MKREYIYFSNKEFDGTVYQTQIVDWLNLYGEYGVKYKLFQFVHPKEFKNPRKVIKQRNAIQNSYNLFKGYIVHFPNTKWFYFINSLLIIIRLLPSIIIGKKIIAFGRVMIGNEIRIINSIFPNRISFIYDARAASAEESKYVAQTNGLYTKSKIKLYTRIKSLEKTTIQESKITFSVSNKLIEYFKNEYAFESNKFFIYPCLSDEKKFYYSEKLRTIYRNQLNLVKTDKLILYAGGFNSEWHIAEKMLKYFEDLNSLNESFKFIILTKDIEKANSAIIKFNIKASSIQILSVKNENVVNYLNAADYGILFRDITPMNIVASPSKFAEYQLSGLPVLITNQVGDFTMDVISNQTGFLINFQNLDMEKHVFELIETNFDRKIIANIAKSKYSKQEFVSEIIHKFTTI